MTRTTVRVFHDPYVVPALLSGLACRGESMGKATWGHLSVGPVGGPTQAGHCEVGSDTIGTVPKPSSGPVDEGRGTIPSSGRLVPRQICLIFSGRRLRFLRRAARTSSSVSFGELFPRSTTLAWSQTASWGLKLDE